MATSIIYGHHAVSSLLANHPDRVQNLYLAPSAPDEVRELAQTRMVRVEPLTPSTLNKELEGAVHQGIVARVSLAGLMQEYAAFIADLPTTPATSLVLLNEITDPYNVGAIIRSAAAFGASGVLIPAHNQSPVTGGEVNGDIS